MVSIIIATYNRPHLLVCAVRSVLNQSYTDFEILVIGDSCEASTGLELSKIKDSRLSYHNLPENIGEQSGPNNHGMSLAQGSYIAFLNDDDLWWPDHLESLLNVLGDKGADMAYSLFTPPLPEGIDILSNIMLTDQSFNPQVSYPASSFLFKKSVYEKIGGWKYHRETYDLPSQDWISRVYQSGLKIASSNRLTLLFAKSGGRKNSYINQEIDKTEFYLNKINLTPNQYRNDLLTTHLKLYHKRFSTITSLGRSVFRLLIERGLNFLGIRLRVLRFILNYKEKGGYIRYLQKFRGQKR